MKGDANIARDAIEVDSVDKQRRETDLFAGLNCLPQFFEADEQPPDVRGIDGLGFKRFEFTGDGFEAIFGRIDSRLQLR